MAIKARWPIPRPGFFMKQMHPALLHDADSCLLVGREQAAAQTQEITAFSPFPPELLLKILQCLPQKDLRAAALASSDFHSLALAAGLFILRTVSWAPLSRAIDRFGVSLAKLDQVLGYVVRTRPSLGIAIRASFMDSEIEAASARDAVDRIMASISLARPYLVSLDLSVPRYVSDSIYTTLCAKTATRLRSLSIEHRTRCPASIPHDLFGGDAPHLRTLSLDVMSTESLRALASGVALRRITRLELTASEVPHLITLVRLFPALRSLAVGGDLRTPQAGTIDLAGLHLDYLALACGTDIFTDPSVLETIPVVERPWRMIETGWPAARDAICAHAQELDTDAATLSIGTADGSWRRTIVLRERKDALPLADAPGLASTLVSVTLAKSLVNAFIQTPLELPALRELFLNISAPHAYCWPALNAALLGLDVNFDALAPARVRVRCPALARVVLFALAGSVTVRPTKVTRLGRALGLGAPGPTPTLTLAGCAFHDPPIWPALNKLFSDVMFVEYSACDAIPGYYRTCRYSGFFDDPKWRQMKG